MILLDDSYPDSEPQLLSEARGAAWQASKAWIDALDERVLAAPELRGVLGDAASHHLSGGGKRIRGRIAIATGLGLGLEPAEFLPIASSVELLHAASLCHDDLQDGDGLRRGRESVWSRYGKDAALLLGDALIAASFAEVVRSRPSAACPLTSAVAGAVSKLAEGQRDDTSPGRPASWTLRDYERTAGLKTGTLLALSCVLPMIAAGEEEEQRSSAGRALELTGVGYQILDDLLDLLPAKGRAVGSDLRSGRMSAVTLHHTRMEGLPRTSARPALTDSVVAVTSDVETLLRSRAIPACLLHQRDAFRRADFEARRLCAEARSALRGLHADLARRSTACLVRTPCAEPEPSSPLGPRGISWRN